MLDPEKEKPAARMPRSAIAPFSQDSAMLRKSGSYLLKPLHFVIFALDFCPNPSFGFVEGYALQVTGALDRLI